MRALAAGGHRGQAQHLPLLMQLQVRWRLTTRVRQGWSNRRVFKSSDSRPVFYNQEGPFMLGETSSNESPEVRLLGALEHLSTTTWMVVNLHHRTSRLMCSLCSHDLEESLWWQQLQKRNKTLWDHVLLVCSWKLWTDLFHIAYLFHQQGQFPTLKVLQSTATREPTATFWLEVPDSLHTHKLIIICFILGHNELLLQVTYSLMSSLVDLLSVDCY